MAKTKTLPSLRIESKTDSLMKQAIAKLNQKSIIKISQNDFVRICLEYFSQLVLSDKELDFKIN